MLYFSIVFFMIGSITDITPESTDIPGLNEPGFWEELWQAEMPPANLVQPFGDVGSHHPQIIIEHEVSAMDVPEAPPMDVDFSEEFEGELIPESGIVAEPDLPRDWTRRERQWAEFKHRREAAAETRQRLIENLEGRDRWLYRRAASFLGPLGRDVALRLIYDASSVRSAAWTTCFYYYVVRVQITVMIFVVMMVAPPLVANDLRGRSFLIYFSSAITRRDYLIGKVSVVMFIIASVTVLPGIALYAVSIAFSPSLGALIDTFHVLLRMTLLIFVIGVPAALAALYLSSRTTHPRFAAFSWIAVWIMGFIFYVAIVGTVGRNSWLSDWAFLISPFHLMTMLAEWVFNVRGQLEAIGASGFLVDQLPEAGFAINGLIFVCVLSVLAALGIQRRISATVNV